MTLDRMKLSAQTVRDNIAILEEVKEPDDAGYYLQLEHEKFVLECIEKQIPKKCTDGFHKEKFIDGRCPSCSFRQSKGDIQWKRQFNKYCRNCGQALDWSDTE